MTPAVPERSHSGAAALRVGDAERDAAASALGEHFAAGRLTHEEFDERTTAAYAARTRGDLDGLFADLPVPRPKTPPQPRAAGPSHVFPALVLLVLVIMAVVAVTSGGFPPLLPILLLLWIGSRRRRAWR